MPEVMAYLNGVLMPKVFNVRTLIVKLWSCIFAVSSGLPVGPEGPMIHLGAMVGAGVSQGRSRTLGISSWTNTNFFKRFRNNKDHRDFIAAGSAAGVAAAFAAPIGGLLFVMEEIASWWDYSLTWMIFFTCIVTCLSADWCTSFFGDFEIHLDNPFDLQLTAMIHFAEVFMHAHAPASPCTWFWFGSLCGVLLLQCFGLAHSPQLATLFNLPYFYADVWFLANDSLGSSHPSRPAPTPPPSIENQTQAISCSCLCPSCRMKNALWANTRAHTEFCWTMHRPYISVYVPL